MDKKREHQATTSYLYSLEPGDGTRYHFGFTNLNLCESVIPGITTRPGGYVMITVLMSGINTGVVVLSRAVLREIQKDQEYVALVLGFATSHGWQHVNKYTKVAVLLAMGVLVDNHGDVDGACDRMMGAGDIIREMYGEE